jgi:hypothetical protein
MEQYIGRKVKGFAFDKNNYRIGYAPEMDEHIGEVGIIDKYFEGTKAFSVTFKKLSWSYPAEEVIKRILPEIPDLPTGVLCWVWDNDDPSKYQRWVIGHKNGKYLGWFGCRTICEVEGQTAINVWDNAEPIIIETITNDDAVQLLKTLTGKQYEIK